MMDFSRRLGFFLGKWLLAACFFLHLGASPSKAEGLEICEISPKVSCLERSKVNQETYVVPVSAMGFSRNALSICDSTFLYTSAPDVILILDNTGSMAKVRTVGGVPRYCSDPADPLGYTEDPGCLSGDPDTLRAKALQAFVDSALAKGGSGTRIGIILFSDRVLNSDPVEWNVLDSNSVDGIKPTERRIISRPSRRPSNYCKPVPNLRMNKPSFLFLMGVPTDHCPLMAAPTFISNTSKKKCCPQCTLFFWVIKASILPT
jgi:hypothetical protein